MTATRDSALQFAWRKLATFLLALGTLLATALVAAPAASAATVVRGTVMCVSQESVVGVWIQAERGGSGWAKTKSYHGYTYKKTYEYKLPKGGRYQVHVGCGWKNKHWWGGGKVWKTSNKSGYVTGGKNFTCIDFKYPKGYRPGSVYNSSFYQKCVVA